jgi:hypothetical protein
LTIEAREFYAHAAHVGRGIENARCFVENESISSCPAAL